ncbi:MAG: hypothetical protein L6R41_001219 [Letrouitia leprolyta]|nr:MAG: hypothetical protein L6R41_001219 [Letrouitia leprolyta]
MGQFVRPEIHIQLTKGEYAREKQGGYAADGYLFTEFRYKQLYGAIARCQKWFEENLREILNPLIRNGEDGAVEKPSPVALFMESDVGMTVYVLSLLGLGVPVLLLSARLSPLSVGHLLKATGAKAVLASSRLRSVASEALVSEAVVTSADKSTNSFNINMYDPVAYDVFFAASSEMKGLDIDDIARANHYVSETDKDVLILHSSGSTGLPKPIYCFRRYLSGFARCHKFASDEVAQGLALSTSPLFHVSTQEII